MSITITICHNVEHCKEHKLGSKQHDECMCVGGPDDLPNINCSFCHGIGVLVSVDIPFEFNLANFNFGRIWNALHLECDECGEITPHKILKHMEIYDPCLSESDLRRYDAINSICQEAMKRGEMVTWG